MRLMLLPRPRYAAVSSRMLMYAGVCWRIYLHKGANDAADAAAKAQVCCRILTYAHVCSRMLAYLEKGANSLGAGCRTPRRGFRF